MDQIIKIFKALGDETRLKILVILKRRNICAKGLAKHLGISEASVSQHLKVLREAGIITGEKIGYYVHYTLQEPSLSKIIEFTNHMNDDSALNICNLEICMPDDCKATCKLNKNKCCHNNI